MSKGGARPGAGRKSLDVEFKRHESITKCFDIVMEFINSDAPLKERAEIAVKIAVRAVPDIQQLSSDPNNPFGVTINVNRPNKKEPDGL